jgi:hypothetical protein
MLVLRLLVLGTMLVMFGSSAKAKVLSASCSNIHGLRIDDTGSKLETDTDQLTGATWAYSWELGKNEAVLMLQGTRGTSPTTERAFVHAMQGGTVSFISLLGGATWVHTLYLTNRKLLVSQHTIGIGANESRLSGKIMAGDCQLNIK